MAYHYILYTAPALGLHDKRAVLQKVDLERIIEEGKNYYGITTSIWTDHNFVFVSAIQDLTAFFEERHVSFFLPDS
ncbi:MAG: hypothetical protein HY006_01815 [Candidatus Sungbacteria bacterium]|nr:hypothetical protein [Candidatus Sungbacteria bacterium]